MHCWKIFIHIKIIHLNECKDGTNMRLNFLSITYLKCWSNYKSESFVSQVGYPGCLFPV